MTFSGGERSNLAVCSPGGDPTMERAARVSEGLSKSSVTTAVDKGAGTMKRAQVAALVAGAALGLAGVAVFVLRREENREAALKLAKTSAEQALKLGNEVARQAIEQYQVQAPRAIETLSGVLPQLVAKRATVSEPVAVEA
jgi:uncharacterized protein HemX